VTLYTAYETGQCRTSSVATAAAFVGVWLTIVTWRQHRHTALIDPVDRWDVTGKMQART